MSAPSGRGQPSGAIVRNCPDKWPLSSGGSLGMLFGNTMPAFHIDLSEGIQEEVNGSHVLLAAARRPQSYNKDEFPHHIGREIGSHQ